MKKINYFSHDFSARNDTKIITLRRKCGMAGLGIFWSLIEMLYEAWWMLACDDETLENLAYEWRCEVEILKIVIFECHLFVVEWEKFYSKSVNERLVKINEASERWRKAVEARWEKARNWYESNTDVSKNDTSVWKNDTDVIQNDTDVIQIKKEINKKINKNTLNPLTIPEVGEASPKSAKTSENKSEKSVLFKKFFAKFPKKTHETEAEIAFLNLTADEIREISKIFPFWLEAWKNTPVNLVPNAYDWLYNRRWREKLAGKIPSANPAEILQNPPTKPKKPKDFFPKIDTEKLEKEAENRKKIVEFFENLPPSQKDEISAKIAEKFKNSPAVKPWDILWQIEICRLTKPLFSLENFSQNSVKNTEKSAEMVEIF